MKQYLWLVLFLLPLSIRVHGQTDGPAERQATEPQVVERGPHHRVVQRWIRETMPDGQVKERLSKYVELATGMHFQRDNQWIESEEIFELFQEGAIARNGQHQVIIGPNLNSDPVDLLASDGKRFVSRLLGLAYTDMSTGQSLLIAEVQDCAGELTAPNEVVFPDALAGPVRCDVRYTYMRSGCEQDLIIRNQLPPPADYGLNPATTRVEVWTEFITAPAPIRSLTQLKPNEVTPALDAQMSDETLKFGAMEIGPGRAFLLDQPDHESTVSVGKNWVEAEGRVFLIEKVDFDDISLSLEKLPQAAAQKPAANGRQAMQARLPKGSRAAALAAIPKWSPKREGRPSERASLVGKGIQIARSSTPQNGLVLDYQIINVNTNDFVFQADSTYFVSGAYNITGTSVIEGSTVIKMTNGAAAKLWFKGPVECQTDTFRPATFTGKDDNTIGQQIALSSGNPLTNWYGRFVDLTGNTNVITLSNVQMRHGHYAIYLDVVGNLFLNHARMSSNYAAVVDYGHAWLRNVLVHHGTYAVGVGSNSVAENCTFHDLNWLRSSSIGTFALTNCLLVDINILNTSLPGPGIVTNGSGTGIFQTVGSAAHYLIGGSTNRDAGTTNINPDLLASLRRLTTYPPLVLSNHFTNDTVLSPQAQRDTDLIDIGYHYPPLDYCWTGLKVSNSRLTLTNDVSIGLYGGSSSYGIGLESASQLVAIGLPHRMARIIRNNLVQEHASGAWSSSTVAPLVKVLTNSPVEPQLQYRFVESVLPAGEGQHLYGWFVLYNQPFGFRDSYFVGGDIYSGDVGLAFTNCVLDRVFLEIEGSSDDPYRYFANNLFRGGTLHVSLSPGYVVTARNNLFDQTSIVQSGLWFHGWNGYLTGEDRLTNAAGTDKVLTSIQYEGGPLGWYYYPTNGGSGSLTDLVNVGNTNSHLLGFYHYTSATNQTKEATSLVDIGFRYIAVNGSGEPVDADGDGLPDYFEDANGNGSTDSGETDWQNSGDQGFRVWITRPRKGNSVP